MPEPIRLALVWHMHQPSYRDAETGRTLLPWARLHATKDYRDMVATLARHPRVHATFNVTPVLWEQLDAIAAGVSDPYLETARVPAERLTGADRRFLLGRFFDVHRERMLMPYPRYRELFERAGSPPPGSTAAPHAGADLTAQDLRDLQVWFHLAWADPSHRGREPLASLAAKGRGFSEEEKASLLRWGVECAGSVAPAYRELEEAGQIEISTSAYHHPILPLVIDSDAPRERSADISLPAPPFRWPADAREQVERSVRAHAKRFGGAPRGAWPPEGAVSQAALSILAAAGYRWVASDESVLAAAIGGREGEPAEWPRLRYQTHRVDTDAGPIVMVFRDRAISDLIGFTYARWEPRAAAEDFVRRVREAGSGWPEKESPVVTVILDGENCWESYEEDGNPFLEALYGLLEADTGIEAVTVSEAIERVPPRSRLTHIPVGSWIRDDLGIWVGHPEKNRAWDELTRARGSVAAAQAAGNAGAPQAMEEIYAAEASDWFWWYGDDHPSPHREVFDRLFRARLVRAYGWIAAPAPASLLRSLSAEAAESAVDAELGGGRPEQSTSVRPSLDGRETRVGEWHGATMYETAGSSGSMHRASGLLRAVRYVTDRSELFVRVDWEPGVARDGATLAVVLAGPPERVARVPLERKAGGVPTWDGPIPSGAGDSGAFATDQFTEIRLPAGLGGGQSGAVVRFRIVLERAGRPEEVAPHSGWFEPPPTPLGSSAPRMPTP